VYSSAVDEMYDSVFYKSFGFALSGVKHEGVRSFV